MRQKVLVLISVFAMMTAVSFARVPHRGCCAKTANEYCAEKKACDDRQDRCRDVRAGDCRDCKACENCDGVCDGRPCARACGDECTQVCGADCARVCGQECAQACSAGCAQVCGKECIQACENDSSLKNKQLP